MAIKMDLSKFKHVGSDGKTITLKHPLGHTITLAYSALSPDNQKQLKALANIGKEAATPLQSDSMKHEKMAEGGSVWDALPSVDEIKNNIVHSMDDPKPKPDNKSQGVGHKSMQSEATTDEYAEGGSVKEKFVSVNSLPNKENKLNYPEIKKEYYEKNGMRRKKDEPEATLNYKGFKEETQRKNRKMYAEGAGEVSQDDNAPQEPPEALKPTSEAALHPTLKYIIDQTMQNAGNPQSPINEKGDPKMQAQAARESYLNSNPMAASENFAGMKAKPANFNPPLEKNVADKYPPVAPQAPVDNSSELPQDQEQTLQGEQRQPASIQQPKERRPVTPQEILADDASLQQAIASGKISPKTYADLWNDKSVPQKIAGVFGMLLGGMGGALTHQPNAAMAMMDNIINRDLEAQKANQGNAYNLRNLSEQHYAHVTERNHMQTLDAQSRDDLNNVRAWRTILGDQWKTIQKMPEITPQDQLKKQQAIQGFNMANSMVDQKAQNAAATIPARMQMFNQMNQPQATGANEDQASAQKLRTMQMSGFISPEQYAKGNEELKMVANKRQANQGALDSFDKVSQLNTLANRASSPIQSQKQINAEWDPMLDKLTKSNEGRVTPITVDMMNGIKPQVGDSPKTTAIKRQKLNEILNAGYSTPILDGIQMSPNKTAPQDRNGVERLDPKSGKIAIFDPKTKQFLRWK